MLFNFSHLVLATLAAALSHGLPLDGAPKARAMEPRAKSYSIVNVDGGSSTPPPPAATTVVEKETTTKVTTKTVKVTDAASTTTDVVTGETPVPTPTSTSKCLSSTAPLTTPTPASSSQQTPNSSEKPEETLAPSIVTVIITETTKPTEFYDDGSWHTLYPVETFEVNAIGTPAAVTSTTPSVITHVPLSTLQTSATSSYNQTQVVARRRTPAL